jgi:serine protease
MPGSVMTPRFDRYAESGYEGTSMAAPHVAGIAALIISQGVTNPVAVETLIKKTARFLGVPDPKTPARNQAYGYGFIQPRVALRGFGLAQ